jgi:hypothetical protein
MEDKLSRLSKSNEKSSDLLKLKNSEIHTKEHQLEIKKFMETKNLNKKSLSNVRTIAPSEVLIKDVPHNPYCSAITSQYAFDLTQISNFNVYFWTTSDNKSFNPCIDFWLSNPTISAVNWLPAQKTQVKKALGIYTTFTGTTFTAPDDMTYANSDIVCVLFPSNYFIGTCYGPYYIKTNPIFVDNKIVYFINSDYIYPTSPYPDIESTNIDEGSYMYMIMVQLWGIGFGLTYTNNNSFGSTILPGMLEYETASNTALGGYIQNNVFNTIMSFNADSFFLPETPILTYNSFGYPETIMPLDALALRWLYNVQEVPEPYISTYGVQLINEGRNDIYHSRMIVGRNQTITFGSRCIDIAFYLSNQYITFNNLNYLRFNYIRNLQNVSSFYTKDIDATISVLNLENEWASIFIENRALTTNLTINLSSASVYQELFLYIMDSEVKYSITGNTVIRNKATGKTITINNPNSRPVNIYFNETTITRNINNRSIKAIENKKEVNREVKSEIPKCRCGNTHKNDLEIQQFIETKNLNHKLVSNLRTIAPSEVIIKPLSNNPYCSAITGTYAFDLTQISNFNVYFWTSSDNVSLNPCIEYWLTDPVIPADNWTTNQKTQVKKALDTFTTFTGTTSTVINNYANCDIVCVLFPSDYFVGVCYGPFFIKENPIFVDNKVVYFINNSRVNTENIKEGGFMYEVFIHEWGHGFGLAHPHDVGFGSTIMPAIAYGQSINYPAIAGYIQNTVFNTIMSYNDLEFFFPANIDDSDDLIGYPQTILPLDALALRWMYDITEIPAQYISTYGVNTINPTPTQLGQSAMIVGPNQTITFGSNNDAVNFYLTNQWFTFYNLQPIKYEYNRPIVKPWSFYPRELDSTISTINLDNTGKAFIFLENRALKTNLTVNIQNNSGQVLNFYCMDCQQNYSIRGNLYRNRTTNKTFTINNTVGATVNVYFDA